MLVGISQSQKKSGIMPTNWKFMPWLQPVFVCAWKGGSHFYDLKFCPQGLGFLKLPYDDMAQNHITVISVLEARLQFFPHTFGVASNKMWPILEFGLLFKKIQHVVVSNNMQISFCLKLSCVIATEWYFSTYTSITFSSDALDSNRTHFGLSWTLTLWAQPWLALIHTVFYCPKRPL